MDPLLVLRRTTEGDELAKHPRKIRNVEWRAVLLLVDGVLPVRELSRRFGESLQIESVLADLLNEGLIEPAIHQPPSPFPDDLPEPRDPQWLARMEGREVAPPPPEPPVAEPAIPEPPETIPAPPPSAASRPAEEDEEEEDVPDKARRRIPFDRIGKGLLKVLAAAAAGGVVAGALLLPEHYRPEIEAEMNAVYSVGVTIGSASLDFSGGPALALEKVQIGGAGGASIPRMLLRPDYRHLLDKGVDVRFPSLEINPTTLALLADHTRRLPRVTRVTFDSLRLRMGPRTLPPLQGVVLLPRDESPHMDLRTEGQGVRIQAEANGLGLDFQFFADEWDVPVLGGFKSSGMQIDGRLTDQILEVTHFGAAAMEGRMEGSARLFLGPEMQLEGILRTTGVEASSVLSGFALATTTSGRITGEFRFASAGKDFGELRSTDRLSGQLRVDRGQFGGIDIPMALRERQPDAVTGGVTPFDSLLGTVEYDQSTRLLKVERLEAGSLVGSGSIRMAADSSVELRGNLLVEVSSGDRQVRAPVEIGGNLTTPNLRVSSVQVSRP